ncbi:hypothetical protein CO015_05510 [candidate division WWE3 bacterium CG_4_8_14_3_um_filter_42_11]|uniref:GIY-YIG domain-containing protein n=1 Tax=candidate division WWE3 bacterium CG_4_8_14_3_um_filter_42_11 TaxID=1975076 RepID=A0A2M8G5D5_UNCKA|nr:MAG: hypothetical protein AUJ38_02110 [bacterium CG1_02_42_9]PJC68022.1 MAG: hypothetical protein CO015_05510 [candidate division WWE3 bacterium CG_4_8_14_3_um_filter_42_11]
MQKQWFTYIITNHTNTVVYIGVTNNLERRIFEHKKGLIKSSFSKKYRLYKVVWFEEFNTPVEAIAAEKMIKGWKREKKNALIERINPHWSDFLQNVSHS